MTVRGALWLLLIAPRAGGFTMSPRPRQTASRQTSVAASATTTTTANDMFDYAKSVLDLPPTEVINGVSFAKYVSPHLNMTAHAEPLIYLPGIEFIGISSGAQLEGLVAAGFEPWVVSVAADDRSSFGNLSAAVAEVVTRWVKEERRPTIMGESFGGLLALDVATKMSEGHRATFEGIRGFVVINPATSYDRTLWSTARLGDVVASTEDVAYAAAIGAAVGLLASDGSMVDKTMAEFTKLDFSSLNTAVDGAKQLAELVPPNTLQWRIGNWLDVGCRSVNDRLWRLRKHKEGPGFLLVAGEEDRFLPSAAEVKRLARELPGSRTEVVILPKGGHAVLVDPKRLNLSAMILDSNVLYKEERKDRSRAKAQSAVDAFTPPNSTVVEETRKSLIEPIRRLTSPVFLSRSSKTAKVQMGLGGITLPSESKRPLLLVGNHQLFGLDLPILVDEFLKDRDTLIRGLAHPVAIDAALFTPTSTKAQTRKASNDWWTDTPPQRRSSNNAGGAIGSDSSFFTKFGAVEVTPRNFVRLMQRNETVLLFPGGVRESNHGKDEAYKLFWPEVSEFVRVAAKYNADIVGFGAVGAADSFNILRDKDEPLLLPGRPASSSVRIPSARKWANDTTEDFRFPLAVPSPRGPARLYFYFAPPVSTADLDHKDREACAEVYSEVKGDVEGSIASLRKARKLDSFERPIQRLAYETALRSKAPTFDVDSNLFDF